VQRASGAPIHTHSMCHPCPSTHPSTPYPPVHAAERGDLRVVRENAPPRAPRRPAPRVHRVDLRHRHLLGRRPVGVQPRVEAQRHQHIWQRLDRVHRAGGADQGRCHARECADVCADVKDDVACRDWLITAPHCRGWLDGSGAGWMGDEGFGSITNKQLSKQSCIRASNTWCSAGMHTNAKHKQQSSAHPRAAKQRRVHSTPANPRSQRPLLVHLLGWEHTK